MAKVYMFPEKTKLPKNMEERLREIAKEYVETLFAILTVLGIEDETDPKFDEVTELMATVYTDGLFDATKALIED